MPCQAVFRKAMVLHEMGQVDESLQVFLHCLALDEDFPCAKRQVEKVREFRIWCYDWPPGSAGKDTGKILDSVIILKSGTHLSFSRSVFI